MTRFRSPTTLSLSLGFLAVYLIWGSTYLAIRFGVESMPPFLMAAVRFFIPGAAIYAWTRARGTPAPTRPQWISSAIVGALLLLGGNGIVTWAEQWVPSGLTALLIASVPLWMGLMNWILDPAARPGLRGLGGLFLGFTGVGILVNPQAGLVAGGPMLWGSFSLILASAFWAAGSLYSRRAELPSNPLIATGMQMLTGSGALAITGTLTGEWARLDVSSITLRSTIALLYLIMFGSIVAFSAYVWLLRVTTPAKVSTYAYVNPVVAVLLGWLLADEALTIRTLVAAAIIVGSVVMITTENASKAEDGQARGGRRTASSPVPRPTGASPCAAGIRGTTE